MDFRDPETPLTEDQQALRRAVAEHVTRHPETLNMGIWSLHRPCGTVACIAGWAIHLSGTDLDLAKAEGLSVTAIGLLGLTEDEFLVTGPDGEDDELFYTDNGTATRRICELAGMEPEAA